MSFINLPLNGLHIQQLCGNIAVIIINNYYYDDDDDAILNRKLCHTASAMNEESITASPDSHLTCFQTHIFASCLAVRWKSFFTRLPCNGEEGRVGIGGGLNKNTQAVRLPKQKQTQKLRLRHTQRICDVMLCSGCHPVSLHTVEKFFCGHINVQIS